MYCCYQSKDHHEINIKDNISTFYRTSTSTTCGINLNNANKARPIQNETLCQCNSRDKIACNMCKHISNDDIESNKIIIKPGDIIKY